MDLWTSPNKLAFLSILAYRITADWKLSEVQLRLDTGLPNTRLGYQIAQYNVKGPCYKVYVARSWERGPNRVGV